MQIVLQVLIEGLWKCMKGLCKDEDEVEIIATNRVCGTV